MQTRHRAKFLWRIIGAIALTMMVIAPVAAQSPYPQTPPAFTDPDNPLSEMFSPRGGQTDRPMLVIFAEFEDLTFSDTDPSNIDAAYLHERFFGGFPSVAGYFDEVSNGLLQLTPAPNTDTKNNGAVNDGIVSVSIDMNKSDFLALGREAEQKLLLEAADPYVDFSQFDVDGNGRIAQDELIFVRQDVDSSPVPVGSGTARRPDPVTLDGVQLGSNNKDTFGTDDLVGVDAGTATNIMTLVHEIGHTAFEMPDTYFWDVGRFDLGGGTSNLDDLTLFRTNAWQAMHLGWAEPTVVTQSGFYDVPRSPAGTSFILYDPDRGTDDFFIVENRAQTSGTYDQGVGDTGLVVWRLDESVYHPIGGGVDDGEDGFITLIRPDGLGSAWSPSLDPFDDQRTIEGVTWRDGTPSNIAIRAISPASDVMRVYFDVRGPGILVDPITHTSDGFPIIHNVTPDEENRPLNIPVMNTGEETDTFEIQFTDLPPGWSTEADVLELDANEEDRAQPALIPAPDAETGEHTVTVVGRSTTNPSVSEQGTITVNVVLDATTITYTGETYVPIGEPAGFVATVTNFDDDHAPVVGVEVTFELSGPGGDLTETATTDANGVASADPVINLPPGDYQLFVSTERFGKHAPGGTSANFRVPTAEERIQDLIDDVIDANLNQGIERSLTAQLEQALAHLEDDHHTAVCNTLLAFHNEVSALPDGHIPDETVHAFLHDVNGIRAQLECGI
jgi:M6 family metalloprotease-like protein